MCNEPFFSANAVMPKVRTFLKSLVDESHRLDPTRPAALGGVQRPTDANGRIDKIGDIAGYNGDGASIAAFQNPGIPNMVSEYNNTAADRPGAMSRAGAIFSDPRHRPQRAVFAGDCPGAVARRSGAPLTMAPLRAATSEKWASSTISAFRNAPGTGIATNTPKSRRRNGRRRALRRD